MIPIIVNRDDMNDKGKSLYDSFDSRSDGYIEPEAIRWILSLASIVGGNIAEIGCFYGGTTAVLARNLPDKTVYTYDWTGSKDHVSEEQRNTVLEWCDVCKLARNMENVVFVHTQSKRIEFPESVRTVIIDADHTYDGVKSDTELVKRSFKSCIIAWHDYVNGSSWVGVSRYIDEIPQRTYLVEGTKLSFGFTGHYKHLMNDIVK